MCGIAGIVGSKDRPVLQHEIDRLTDFLAYRGPDGRGTWQNNDHTVSLGHRRLSILDLSEAGKQPMVTTDDNLVIVFNGEIYNFLEIKAILQSNGFVFKSDSDTEVLLYAYQCWGTEMLHKLNGMWALAIYNKRTGELFLSRDRYGVKPLYYYFEGGVFVFASEIKAIHQYLGQRVTVNLNVIGTMLHSDIDRKRQYHGTEQTYLNEVKSLPGGFNLTLRNQGIHLTQWYTLNRVSVSHKFEDQAMDLKSLLTDACKIRLRSDVPIGTCLSGGVDSGSIASIIDTFDKDEKGRFSNFSYKSFCASFPDTVLDESPAAKRLSLQKGLKLEVVPILPPTPEEMELAMSDCDGPMPALAFFPIWKLYQHIKAAGITVTLDGQGPDEMLGGYYIAYDAMNGGWSQKNPIWVYDLYKTYAELFPGGKQFVYDDFKWLLKNKLVNLKQTLKQPIKEVLSLPGWYHKKELAPSRELPVQPVRSTPQHINPLEQSLFNQFFQNPLPFILNQYDRASMAHGVECRMPFMDYRVVEYVFSLPGRSKVGHGYTKRVLRESMKGLLPDDIRLNKRKTGFNAPINEWLNKELKSWYLDQLHSSYFLQNSLFDGKLLCEKYSNYFYSGKGTEDYTWGFWIPLHIAWWHEKVKKY